MNIAPPHDNPTAIADTNASETGQAALPYKNAITEGIACTSKIGSLCRHNMTRLDLPNASQKRDCEIARARNPLATIAKNDCTTNCHAPNPDQAHKYATIGLNDETAYSVNDNRRHSNRLLTLKILPAHLPMTMKINILGILSAAHGNNTTE
jgi:hypothetical protein